LCLSGRSRHMTTISKKFKFPKTNIKKGFQNYKKSNQKVSQIVFHKELCNPDSSFTWKYVGARINPRRAQKAKNIFWFLL